MSSLKLRKVRLVTVDAVVTDSNAPLVLGPQDAANVARAILPTDREGFAVLHLDTRKRVRSVELASVGTLTATIVHPREVFKGAILANAHSIIVAHNHPSGDPTPSDDDERMTRALIEAGQVIGIEVVDHIIVAGERSLSMREEKIL